MKTGGNQACFRIAQIGKLLFSYLKVVIEEKFINRDYLIKRGKIGKIRPVRSTFEGQKSMFESVGEGLFNGLAPLQMNIFLCFLCLNISDLKKYQ